jgi:hypothetical protein
VTPTTLSTPAKMAVATGEVAGAGAGPPGGPSGPSVLTEAIQSSPPIKHEPIFTKKFYRNQPVSLLLISYLRMLFSNDPVKARTLSQKLAEQASNKRFQSDLGLARNVKCSNCTSKNPCPLLTAKDLHDMIASCFSKQRQKRRETVNEDIKHFNDKGKQSTQEDLVKRSQWENSVGNCDSCDVLLSMWDVKRETQMMSCWTICSFNATCCKSKVIEKDLRILCRGCHTLAEAAYFDLRTFNIYRAIMFKHVKTKDRSMFTSSAYYFPKIDCIDDKSRYVVTGAITNIGNRTQLNKQWLKQRGFPVYPFTPSLEKEMVSDPDWIERIRAVDHPNEAAHCSEYYGPDDDDIKEPGKLISSRLKKTKTSAATDSVKRTKLNPVSVAASTVTRDIGDIKELKSIDDDDLDDEYLMKALSAENREAVKVADAASGTDFYDSKKFITFKIPIDPRKGMRKRHLLGLRTLQISGAPGEEGGEFVLTNKLLDIFDQHHDRDQWMRWLMDVGRLVTPMFVPERDEKSSKFTEAELVALRRIAELSETEKKRMITINEAKKLNKESAVERFRLTDPLRPKLISAVESGSDLTTLANAKLKPVMSERGRTKTSMKQDILASSLPSSLSRLGLILGGFDGKDMRELTGSELEAKCSDLAEDLFDNLKVGARKTTFSLKFDDPEDARRKEEKKATRKRKK